MENSNGRIVRPPIGSRFVAANVPAADKIFSGDSARRNRYFGVKPNVRSKRLA
jgi:hypothetical protein